MGFLTPIQPEIVPKCSPENELQKAECTNSIQRMLRALDRWLDNWAIYLHTESWATDWLRGRFDMDFFQRNQIKNTYE